MIRLKQRLNQSRLSRPFMGALRSVYRPLRTKYLRMRYPRGGYVTGNGVRVFCDFNDPTYAWYDADAPNLAFDVRVIRTVLPQTEGNVFVDVGAHFGFFSAAVAGTASVQPPITKIFAFEPDQHHYRCLERTMAPFSDIEVGLLPFAVGERDGAVQLHRSSDSPCLHSYADETTLPTYSVESIRLDTFTERYLTEGDRMALVKIDVDGAEPSVFAGGTRLFETHGPIIVAEFAPKSLRRNNTDPRRYFAGLCDLWEVYWLRSEEDAVTRVTVGDYAAIEKQVGEAVADLLLSPMELHFSGFLTS